MTEVTQENTPQLSPESKNKALIAYILGFITGIIMLMNNPKDEFVRFHAIQSIGLSLLSIVAGFIFSRFSYSLGSLVNVATLVLFVIAAMKAYQGEKYLVPVVGEEIQKLGKSIKI